MSDLIEFDDFTLDAANAVLRRKQVDIHLTPKAFEVLSTLLIQPGQLVTKEQLLAAVWPDVIVSDSAISACIRELRQALGDEAKAPRYIETVHRRGYRFCAAVTVRKNSSTSAVDDKVTTTVKPAAAKAPRFSFNRHRVIAISLVIVIASLLLWRYLPEQSQPSVEHNVAYPLPDEPSIAVLPFDNMSSDPEQDYFSDGITEDLITDLSKLRGLIVIARNSSFAYKGKAVDVRQVGKELRVRHVLEGSVRKAGGQVRINAQLVNTATGDHVWTQRFDRPLADIFAVQDEIGQQIIAALDVALSEGDQARVWRQTTDNPAAYELFLQGREEYLKFNPEANYRAQQALEQAIALAPNFAEAWVKLGWVYSMQAISGWSESASASSQKAWDCAQRALKIDASLSDVHALLFELYGAEGKPDRASQAIEKAVLLNPNGAKNVAIYAYDLASQNRIEEALAAIQKAMRLNPNPPIWYRNVLGHIYLAAERYDEAVTVFADCAAQSPDYISCAARLVMAYMAAGRENDARATANKVLRINPNFSSSAWVKLVGPMFAEQRLKWLRKAGLPE